jgi:tetraacyldisaccharide 4'-kinase
MTAGLRGWLEARWWQQAPVPGWLAVLSRLYGRVAHWRRRRATAAAVTLPVPLVVVGNVAVGGTGKTPVVIALVEALVAAGFRPGVVSRGYGGRGPGGLVPADGDPGRYGDEPVLIARRTGVPVWVDRDRVAAGRALLAGQGVDVIVADDGLQHYRLARTVEIAVVDGSRRFGNGRLLPAGPLREPTSRLAQVDLVLVNGLRSPHELGFDLRAGDPRALRDDQRRPLAAFTGSPVHAVAGIGDPSRFFASLRAAGLEPIEHPFPDHHRFRPGDLAFGDPRPVLMTEKDAVKCARFAQANWYALPVSAALPAAAIARVLERLRPDPPADTSPH